MVTGYIQNLQSMPAFLQAVCLMLNDPVLFRFQWPRHSDLRINGVSYRVYSRPNTSKIGNNVRDEPASLSTTAFNGKNRIRLQVLSLLSSVDCPISLG